MVPYLNRLHAGLNHVVDEIRRGLRMDRAPVPPCRMPCRRPSPSSGAMRRFCFSLPLSLRFLQMLKSPSLAAAAEVKVTTKTTTSIESRLRMRGIRRKLLGVAVLGYARASAGTISSINSAVRRDNHWNLPNSSLADLMPKLPKDSYYLMELLMVRRKVR